MRHAARMRQKGKNIMKAEIKFAITKNGPKAFMSTYNDDMSLRGTLVPFSYCEMRILPFSSAESPDFSASSVCVKPRN